MKKHYARRIVAHAALFGYSIALTAHSVKENGWEGSFEWDNTIETMRRHKVVSALYLASLGAATYYTFRDLYDAVQDQREADRVYEKIKSIEEIDNVIDLLSYDELTMDYNEPKIGDLG